MRIADRPRLAARVVTHLTREISTGVVAPGAPLPSEATLADRPAQM